MRKPVSKHALRRALDEARDEGLVQWSEPTGAVVDHIWHLIEKEGFAGRKKPEPRTSLRDVELVEV